MEIKRNEATLNRPEGDRVLDAPFVFLDIPSYLRQLKKEKAWKENDRNGITIFKSEGITIVITILKQGAMISDNTVDGYLVVQILDGQATIQTIEGDFTADKKNAVTFHPGITHTITASADTALLITTFNEKNEF